jgi:hypothetical protein
MSAIRRTQIKQFVQFANDFVTAARASLKNDALQMQLDLKLLPHAELKALYGNGLGGKPLYERIQAEANKFIDDALAQIRKLGCFVAGTLVHTREGLKPIEEIKVGDYVLSKPESGEGEFCYQPVTRTYEYENREVYYISLVIPKNLPEGEKPDWDYDCVAVTGGHPIWVERMTFWRGLETEMEMENTEIRDIHAWMIIEELWQILWKGMNEPAKENLTTPIYVELADGRIAEVRRIIPILQSREPNVGVVFTPGDNWSFEPCGMTLHFGKNGVLNELVDRSLSPGFTYLDDPCEADYDYSDYDTTGEMSVVNITGGHLPMRRKVYNLEVANTHTYFVTRFGLWVHNNSGASLPLIPAQNLGVYMSQGGAAGLESP